MWDLGCSSVDSLCWHVQGPELDQQQEEKAARARETGNMGLSQEKVMECKKVTGKNSGKYFQTVNKE